MIRALVTGGSGDIGSAVCRKLANEGAHVIVHAASRPEFSEVVASNIMKEGGSAETIRFDVTDTGASRASLERLLNDGPVQILISNAGIHDDAPMAGMTTEQWKRVIDVSLHGFYNVCQPLLLPMMSTRWGRIVAVSSVAGQMGNRGQANYAAAKAGLHGAVKSLSRELASRGVTANAVAPGVIQGDMTEQKFSQEEINILIPAKRAGVPEEVADLVSFLASNSASYITGQVIGINGGMI